MGADRTRIKAKSIGIGVYEELEAMERRPDTLCEMIENVLAATTVNGLKEQLTLLMKGLDFCFRQAMKKLQQEKKPACEDTLSGRMRKCSPTGTGRWCRRRKEGTGIWLS